jgi:hypothetical protein
MMIEGDILVLGAYGAVGSAATRQLAEWFPGRVRPAGRDPARADNLAAARPLRVDVRDVAGFARILADQRIGVVVLCVEPPDEEIARACLSRGVHLVDVGASPGLLARTEAVPAPAATAVLSVGLAPGLTNLLARRAHELVGAADRLEITVMLGAGERHGLDALRWTLAGLAGDPPTERPRRIALPRYGTRTAHPFPFSDQYTLRRTLGVPEATTRLCLDSAPLTAVLFGLRRIGAFRAARRPAVLRSLSAALHRMHLGGGDGFAVRVDAVGTAGSAALALTGRDQSRVTGLVAAHVTREILSGGLPPGVHHIDQLDRLATVPDALGGAITLQPPQIRRAS